MFLTVALIAAIVVLSCAVVVIATKNDALKLDLRMARTNAAGLESIIERQGNIIRSNQAEIETLRAQAATDASGRVGRGQHGRFVSVKG